MAKINELLRESTVTNSIQYGRPNLVALTRATTKLVYTDIVAEQRTTQPVAALYGVKYETPDDELSFKTGATYGGAASASDRDSIEEITSATQPVTAGTLYKYNNVVYKALESGALNGATIDEALSEALITLKLRFYSEAAETAKFESNNVEISSANFTVNKWNARVKTRKLKTSLTVELAQDLEANGFDANMFLEDLLATTMADEINKDVLQSLITVSKRYKVAGVSDD